MLVVPKEKNMIKFIVVGFAALEKNLPVHMRATILTWLMNKENCAPFKIMAKTKTAVATKAFYC